MTRQKRAFTFIEILLVSALVATLSLSIFTCLSNGLKLWERSRRTVMVEDLSLFLDRFSSDLHNAFIFSTLSLEGAESSIAFPTVVLTKADSRGVRAPEEYVDQLGRVQYAFDPSFGTVIRRQANYSQGTHKGWGEEHVVVTGIKELRFKYYYPGAKEYQLHAEAGDVLPSGVEVEARFMDGGEEKTLSRFVPVPLGT